MRIISPFRDFYDCAQSLGQDQTLLYNRQPKEVKIEKFPFVCPQWWGSDARLEIVYYVVGFCGRVYPVLKLTKNEIIYDPDKTVNKICFTLDDIDNFITDNYKKDIVDAYTSKKYRWGKGWKLNLRREKLKMFFDEFNQKKDNYGHLFEQERSPVFCCSLQNRKWHENKAHLFINYNCSLKDFEFYRLFDPYTAYQEIAMYFGNMAEPRKNIPDVSDEILSEIKGFNEFSFRKPKKEK